MASAGDVTSFLGSIGLEQCVQAVVHNGFYTSMEALRGATYEELVDSGVRPVHAKLILSNLGVKGAPMTPLGGRAGAPTDEEAGSGDEVATFLRSVGLETCLAPLTDAGYTSLDGLSRASLQELLGAGIKPVHARLIVSNLDSATSAGITLTPAAQRLASLDEETLLGGPRKRRSSPKLYMVVLLALLLILMASFAAFRSSGPPPTPTSASATAALPDASHAASKAARKGKGEGEHKPAGEHKPKGEGEHKGKLGKAKKGEGKGDGKPPE